MPAHRQKYRGHRPQYLPSTPKSNVCPTNRLLDPRRINFIARALIQIQAVVKSQDIF